MKIKLFVLGAMLASSAALPLAAQTASKPALSPSCASAIALAVQPGTIAEAKLDAFKERAGRPLGRELGAHL